MRHELIDRYIYDVTKTYSKSERERMRNEIATDIDIKLSEFGEEDSVTDQQIKEVLIELGTSKDIAKKYAKNGDIALVSQPYYGQYKKMMWTGVIIAALWILAFNAFDLIIRQGVTNFGPDMISVIVRAIESILISGFAIYSVNTMAFSMLSKEKSNPRKTAKYIEALNGIPKNGVRIGGNLVLLRYIVVVIISTIFIFTPVILSVEFYDTSRLSGALPIFSIEYLKGIWLMIFVVFFFRVLQLGAKLTERRYNRKVLSLTIIASIFSINLLRIMFVQNDAIRNEYIWAIQQNVPSNVVTDWIFNFFNITVAIVFLVLILAEVIITLVKYSKDSKVSKSKISTVPFGEKGFIQDTQTVEKIDIDEEITVEETIGDMAESEVVEETIAVEKIDVDELVEDDITEENPEETIVLGKYIDDEELHDSEETIVVERVEELVLDSDPIDETILVEKIEDTEDIIEENIDENEVKKEIEVSEETIVLGKYEDDEEVNYEQDTKVVNIITEDTKVEINEDTIVIDKIDDEKDI